MICVLLRVFLCWVLPDRFVRCLPCSKNLLLILVRIWRNIHPWWRVGFICVSCWMELGLQPCAFGRRGSSERRLWLLKLWDGQLWCCSMEEKQGKVMELTRLFVGTRSCWREPLFPRQARADGSESEQGELGLLFPRVPLGSGLWRPRCPQGGFLSPSLRVLFTPFPAQGSSGV